MLSVNIVINNPYVNLHDFMAQITNYLGQNNAMFEAFCIFEMLRSKPE